MLALVGAGFVVGALRGEYTDLSVYRYGGRTVLEGLRGFESGDPVTGLWFTYPPFGAVAMVPTALVPSWLAAALWTAASMGALACARRAGAALAAAAPHRGGWSRC